MDITIKLELEDWYRYQLYLEKELPKTVKPWANSYWFNLVLWIVIAFLLLFIFQITGDVHWPTAGVVSLLFILVSALFIFDLTKLKKAFAPSALGMFIGEHQFVFDEEGIKTKGKGYESNLSWSLVRQIERTNGMFLIFLDTAYAYVFPESKLEHPEQLYIYINKQYKNY